MAPTKIAVSIKNFVLEKCDNFIDNDRSLAHGRYQFDLVYFFHWICRTPNQPG
jgi:hypothetical protein